MSYFFLLYFHWITREKISSVSTDETFVFGSMSHGAHIAMCYSSHNIWHIKTRPDLDPHSPHFAHSSHVQGNRPNEEDVRLVWQSNAASSTRTTHPFVMGTIRPTWVQNNPPLSLYIWATLNTHRLHKFNSHNAVGQIISQEAKNGYRAIITTFVCDVRLVW